MVVFDAFRVLVLATVVWAGWRIAIWRRDRGDVVRELTIVGLFAWSLLMVRFMLFPLNIIFYDWHGRFSLVPFASIIQLLRDTSPTVAFENIVGNVLLFVPLGVLLPALFKPLRRLWPLLWRAAFISVVIETVQLMTRARAVDIDDVILNTLGAAIGFAVHRLIAGIAVRSSIGQALLDRIGAEPKREALLLPAFPVLMTAAIAVPIMVSTIIGSTLGDGPGGIFADATTAVPGSTVVARGDVGADTFLVVQIPTDGISFAGYEKVLPGRFTWVVRGEPDRRTGGRYNWGITAYNTAREETPTVYVWGANEAGAVELIVRGQNVDERLLLPDADYFVVGFPYLPDPTAPTMEEFVFQFLDRSGTDVTDQFAPPDR